MKAKKPMKLTPDQQRQVEVEKSFRKWWDADGRYIDPDPEVDWYDKRLELAFYAFQAGQAERLAGEGK